ncbi:MAG: hypothetical protein IKP97_05710 [Kiritimatiellae bacterium]|nr:hypothetical protein [Kiritimatiellia bacterium]
MLSLCSSLLILVGMNTYRQPEWKAVVDELRDAHADMTVNVLVAAPEITDFKPGAETLPHRYVAVVMTPEEATCETIVRIGRTMSELDGDLYEDAIWGVVTAPTPADALRMVKSQEPGEIESALGTTGLDRNLVQGPMAVFSDANPPGRWWLKDESGKVEEFGSEGDISSAFGEAWGKVDPELLVTSSHASERNLEMPFSRGNIVATEAGFAECANAKLIDYATGQAKADKLAASLQPLPAPVKEKVWLAAGNCLIANNQGNPNMVMTALGWGKCNQFFGYMTTTWFGFMGWETLRQYASLGRPLGEARFAAKVTLQAALSSVEPDSMEERGLKWDEHATVLYGDPVKRHTVKRRGISAWHDGELPLVIVLPEAKSDWKAVKVPAGTEVEIHDDFAFAVGYPAMGEDWEKEFGFE